MEKLKGILKKIFILPSLLTVLFAFLGFSFILIVAIYKIDIKPIQYISYVLSAYALIITVTALPRFRAYVKSLKRSLGEQGVVRRIKSTPVGNRIISDVRFRTKVMLYLGLFICRSKPCFGNKL